MNVALSTADFLYRARTVQAAKLGGVDEPGVPGGLGRQTYGMLALRCDGFVEALDRLGIGPGERVAIVSPNSLKFLIALWAATGSGRVLVPINFRLDADEVAYIVEDAEASLLLEHPDVVDVAVIGVPHERWGETPRALVVLRPGASLDEPALIAFTRQRLAHFKCPTSVQAIDALPRTATGKVQKYLLRKRAE